MLFHSCLDTLRSWKRPKARYLKAYLKAKGNNEPYGFLIDIGAHKV